MGAQPCQSDDIVVLHPSYLSWTFSGSSHFNRTLQLMLANPFPHNQNLGSNLPRLHPVTKAGSKHIYRKINTRIVQKIRTIWPDLFTTTVSISFLTPVNPAINSPNMHELLLTLEIQTSRALLNQNFPNGSNQSPGWLGHVQPTSV